MRRELIGLHLHSWNTCTLMQTKYGNTCFFDLTQKEQSASLQLNRCDLLDSKMAHTK